MNNSQKIFMDYQSTTPVDRRVLAAMQPYFSEQFGNPHSSEHSFGWEASLAVDGALAQLSRCLGCDSDELTFTSGATEANNAALLGLFGDGSSRRTRILVSAVEHRSVLACASHLGRRALAKVEIIPVDASGIVDLNVLENLLTDDVLLVSVMAVNNEVGSIQPLGQIAEMCARVGAYLHSDATQAAGACDLDTLTPCVHLMSLSSHKIYGPKGIGVLYARRDLRGELQPIIHGGGQQGGMRSGTLPVPLCVGFGEAAMILERDGDLDRRRISSLRDELAALLHQHAPQVRLNGPPLKRRHTGNLNMAFPGVDAPALLGALQPRVAASSGSACTSGVQEPSHVLLAMGLNHSLAESSIRLSLGRFSTNEDVATGGAEILGALRRLSAD